MKIVFLGMGIPMLKTRQSWDRLVLNMGIPLLVRRHLNIETASWLLGTISGACHPGGHCWDYYPGTFPCCPVSATHLKIGYPLMKPTGVHSLDELQWLHLQIGHQDSSPSDGHQGDLPCSLYQCQADMWANDDLSTSRDNNDLINCLWN